MRASRDHYAQPLSKPQPGAHTMKPRTPEEALSEWLEACKQGGYPPNIQQVNQAREFFYRAYNKGGRK